jgi:hypothetical protein
MAYQSHHYSSILLCSTCISVFLLASSCALCSSTLSLHVHLNILFYAHESQLKTPSLLYFPYIYHAKSSTRSCMQLFVLSCSYSLQNFSIFQLSLWWVFIPLEVISRLFKSSGDHLEALWILWKIPSVHSRSYRENLHVLIPLAPFPFLRKLYSGS